MKYLTNLAIVFFGSGIGIFVVMYLISRYDVELEAFIHRFDVWAKRGKKRARLRH